MTYDLWLYIMNDNFMLKLHVTHYLFILKVEVIRPYGCLFL